MKRSKRYGVAGVFLAFGVVMVLLGFGEARFVAALLWTENPAVLYSVLRWLGVFSLIIGVLELT